MGKRGSQPLLSIYIASQLLLNKLDPAPGPLPAASLQGLSALCARHPLRKADMYPASSSMGLGLRAKEVTRMWGGPGQHIADTWEM